MDTSLEGSAAAQRPSILVAAAVDTPAAAAAYTLTAVVVR